MSEPMPPQTSETRARDQLRESYLLIKDEFLDLCCQYDLPPRELTLSTVERGNLDREDRVKLFRLVVLLNELELILGPGSIDESLFAENEARYLNSGIFGHKLH